MSNPSTPPAPTSTSPTSSQSRAGRVWLRARNISLIAAIAAFACAFIRKLFSLGLIGKVVVAGFLVVWGVAGLTFAAAGLLLAFFALRRRVRGAAVASRLSIDVRMWPAAILGLGRRAAVAIWLSSNATRYPETWPFLMCGALVAASSLGLFQLRVGAWAFVGAVLLGTLIAMVRFTVDSVREVNQSVDILRLTSVLLLGAFEAVFVGAVITPPVGSGAFYAVAQIDAAVLIAAVVAADIPRQWAKNDRLAWTWVVTVVGLILLAIVAAVAGGLIADRQPPPEWFNRDVLQGSRTLSTAPSTFLLGASAMPVVLGLMHLAQGTYARIKVHRPSS